MNNNLLLFRILMLVSMMISNNSIECLVQETGAKLAKGVVDQMKKDVLKLLVSQESKDNMCDTPVLSKDAQEVALLVNQWLLKAFSGVKFSFDKDNLKESVATIMKEQVDPCIHELKNVFDPEKLRKIASFLPVDVRDLFSDDQDKKNLACEKIVAFINNQVSLFDSELHKQGFFEKVKNIISPSPSYFARYGAVFGASSILAGIMVHSGYTSLHDYFQMRKSKYLLPISTIGRIDRIKDMFLQYWPLKKRCNIDADEQMFIAFKKQLKNKSHTDQILFFEKDNQVTMHTCAATAKKLNMDFIAVSAVSLLQGNIGIELWHDIIQLVHKNSYKTVIVIDQAELLSTFSKEYTKHEELVRMLASSFQSAASVFAGRCVIVGLTNNKEKICGPFQQLCITN